MIQLADPVAASVFGLFAGQVCVMGVCMAHAGQGCVLGTRVFVPQDEKAKVLEAMKASLAYARIGDSTDPETTMGPVISEAQVQRCERYVKLAVEAGRYAYLAGRMPRKLYASASSPMSGVVR